MSQKLMDGIRIEGKHILLMENQFLLELKSTPRQIICERFGAINQVEYIYLSRIHLGATT